MIMLRTACPIILVILLNLQKINAQELTLSSLLKAALQNNPQLQSARLGITAASWRVRSVTGRGLPQVSVSGRLSWNTKLPVTPVPAEFFGGPPGSYIPVQFGTKYAGELALQVNQLIWDASYLVGIKAAVLYKEVKNTELIAQQENTIKSVALQYLSLLSLRKELELSEKRIILLETLFRKAVTMCEGGIIVCADTQQIALQLEAEKLNRERLRQQIHIQANTLKTLCGVEINPQELAEINESFLLPLDTIDVNENPQVSLLSLQEQGYKLQLRQIQSGYLPRIFGFWRLGTQVYEQEFENTLKSNNWKDFGAVGVSIVWEPFTGFSREAEQFRIKAEKDALHLQKEFLISSILNTHLQLRSAYELTIKELSLREEAIKVARDVYERKLLHYNSGTIPVDELLTAETNLHKAQVEKWEAFYRAARLRVEWLVLAGKASTLLTEK